MANCGEEIVYGSVSEGIIGVFSQENHTLDGVSELSSLTITVRVFGGARRAACADCVLVSVSEVASSGSVSVAEVLRLLAVQCPALTDSLRSARLAVNHSFVTAASMITANDEVALIALVGGG